MKISQILSSNTFSLSFEVFPPKTDTAFNSVKTAVEEIAKLKPSFMSVTYGAGGDTSKYTLDIEKDIKATYQVPTLAHLTCVSSSKETVKEKIKKMKNRQVLIKLLKAEADWCKTIVGGAVLTQEYAEKIGADKYAKDAMETVRFAQTI